MAVNVSQGRAITGFRVLSRTDGRTDGETDRQTDKNCNATYLHDCMINIPRASSIVYLRP